LASHTIGGVVAGIAAEVEEVVVSVANCTDAAIGGTGGARAVITGGDATAVDYLVADITRAAIARIRDIAFETVEILTEIAGSVDGKGA
jgi:hypothetical protein